MSMLNSLEIRSPLLDKRIAELCFSEAHSSLKRKGNVKKYLLKKLLKNTPERFHVRTEIRVWCAAKAVVQYITKPKTNRAHARCPIWLPKQERSDALSSNA